MNLLDEFRQVAAEARAEWLAGLTPEQRAELESALLAEFNDVRAQAASVERNAALAELRDEVAAVRDAQAAHAAEHERLEAEAAEIDAALTPADGGGDDAADDDADENAPDDAGDADGGQEGQEQQPETPPAQEQLAAAGAPARRRPRFPGPAHRPASHAPRPRPESETRDGARLVLTASGRPGTMREVAQEIIARRGTFGNVPKHGTERISVARILPDYPDDQRFGTDASGEQFEALVAALTQRKLDAWFNTPIETLVAAGGRCAMPEPYYGMMAVGDDARPARAALPQINAARGAITFRPPPTLADVIAGDGVGIWTDQDSIDALDDEDVRKTCQRVPCPDPLTAAVQTIYKCLIFDNLDSITDPERVEKWVNLTMQAQSLLAEREILTAIGDDSTHIIADRVLGSARDILAFVDLLATGIRDRHNVSDAQPIEVWLPRWSQALIRTDVLRQMPGDGLETLGLTLGQMIEWFRSRNIVPTFFRYGEVGQNFGAQNQGDLVPFPSRLVGYAFMPGEWALLDRDGIDIGPVRDSVLNRTNDYELFAETHEGVAHLGPESVRFDMPTCPTGATSGTIDVDAALDCAAS